MIRVTVFIAILAGILFGYLFKGKITNLSNLSFRALPLLILSVFLRFIVFREFFLNSELAPQLGSLLQNLSNLMATFFLLLNLRLHGLKLVFLGALLNSLAIFLNGGRMPASPKALKLVNHQDVIVRIDKYQWYPSSLADPETKLSFLCDVIPFRFPFKPLQGAISIGDILILVGILILIVVGMQKKD